MRFCSGRRIHIILICSIPFLLYHCTDWDAPYMPDVAQEEMSPYSYEEMMEQLEDGDILITFDSHFLSWRNGHAAIVVDADDGLILEAKTIGVNSTTTSIRRWGNYHSFALLRLNSLTEEERSDVAAYAYETMADIPYSLIPRISRQDEQPTATHCSHLIWYSYLQYGYDLDSDGGFIVTPRDLYDSSYLERIAVYDTTKTVSNTASVTP